MEGGVVFAFEAVYGLAKELAVEVEADLGDVAGLFGAEEVVGAANSRDRVNIRPVII